jgi:hypothetical protein
VSAFIEGVQKAYLTTGQTFHQSRNCGQVVVRLNNQMNMVRHEAVTEHIQLIDLLPFLKIRQEALKATALNEHRLAIMTALNNIGGELGTITLTCLGISVSLLLIHRVHSVRWQPILTKVRRGLVTIQISSKPSEKRRK